MNERIIRVFPRQTSHTPTDALAFVGDPPLWRPEADEVHVSATFTWDVEEARRLQAAWGQYYDRVLIGGPAIGDYDTEFRAGRYVKEGITFSSRGCNRACPWCLVPKREGRLQPLERFPDGYVIGDNNFLQCPREHRQRVYTMLGRQPKAAVLSGGIDARLVTNEVAQEFRDLRIEQLFLAADTSGALRPLARAAERLAFLGRRKLRCYVLVAYGNETLQEAEQRLEAVWQLGCMPFAQLYQPPSPRRLVYSADWQALQRRWSRPAAMVAIHAHATEEVAQ